MFRLELVGITKQYPAVLANDGVNLQVAAGEIHAVLGENGAGKSTLMKIIYGAVPPDAGQILWNGQPVTIASPQEARALGIAMVFQHFSLFETLTVAENVWLGLEKGQTLAGTAARIAAVSVRYGLDIEPQRPVHSLSVGERQRVEIIRALLTNPSLLILDEPTSVLTPQAVQKLFATLRELAKSGCAILYISHKLDEIRALCSRCTVMRAGKVTGVIDPREESNASLSRLMIGSEPPTLEQREGLVGGTVLSVRGLTAHSVRPFGVALEDVSLDLAAGQILGVAGVSGNGQRELLAALSGEEPWNGEGAIVVFGSEVTSRPPPARRALGLHFVPEERLGRAAVPHLSLAENTLLTRTEPVGRAGLLRFSAMQSLANRLIDAFRVKAGGSTAAACSLSGGNLQKFIMGREIDAKPKVLIVAQPTWGVDVGAAAQIRGELLKLRDAGCAILVVSEDLDELFQVCDDMVVIAAGRLSPRVHTRDVTVEQIGQWMSGLWDYGTRAARSEAAVA